MKTNFKIIKNTYRDSVSLMQIAAKLNQIQGVKKSSVNMATPANLALLFETGYDITKISAGPNDLLVSVIAENDTVFESVFALVDNLLNSKNKTDVPATTLAIKSIAQAQKNVHAGLALISVSGEYAVAEAYKALNSGMHTMIFSDNISSEDERVLKEHARDLGKIVMGPDCGTAIIDGIPLAFANVINKGVIGLVAASGTGLQSVTTLIDRFGGGISQAIGTGGHDLSAEIGGISMLTGLDMLTKDNATKVITLISKPPAHEVVKIILDKASLTSKKVVVCFLGGDPSILKDYSKDNIYWADTLEAASLLSLKLINIEAKIKTDLTAIKALKTTLKPEQKYIRGLFSGGTFCYEATILLQEKLEHVFSNTAFGKAQTLINVWHSNKHTLLDLGDDIFTRGRPHPMIDLTFRNERILKEAADPTVAVIILDLVIGYGAHSNPASDLAETIYQAKKIAKADGRELHFITYICGTYKDPQNLARQEQLMLDAGVILAESNLQLVNLSLAIIGA